MPLMRPVFFEEESVPWLIDVKDSYFWGDAFYVMPVTDPGLDSMEALVPPGAWFDFWTDTRYEGNNFVNIPVTLGTIPVLVRAGSFVPMVDVVQTTRDYSSETLTLHYYADESVAESSGHMYEDDGHSRTSLEDGAYEILRFRATRDGDVLKIAFDREGGGYDGMPESRKLELVIHNWTAPVDALTFDGQPVEGRLEGGTLTVELEWNHELTTLQVNEPERVAMNGKPVVYQVFTRLFGNKETANKPWGTIEENGVGKFADFTDEALQGIRELGVSHIWYTGVPHHAVVRDYVAFGISNDDPDVVKGRAGSPYAVKDYYNVNPDLATDPAKRLEEFDALIERTHANGMRVVIDIVPNHVARDYESTREGVTDFGANDDTSVAWARDNNFYYAPGEDFVVPEGYVPLNGEAHPLADGKFAESPAKWTGNGARAPQPGIGDWFETVKINFGVRPDGSKAFDELPEEARTWTNEQLVEFWSERDVPDSWRKFHDIVHFWLDRGVDGFRYDMAQMVPVEFWSYLNASIKVRRPDAFLLSEIYVPEMYRDYIELGRMDYLYDKVGFYDTLRAVMRGEQPASALAETHAEVLDIEEHMLHFLENHDEQRIASEPFAGDARMGKPGMVVSSLISAAPTMIYFGQAVGEPGDGDAGFGTATRTTIFDYWGVPAHQRWMNGGAFDGGALSENERSLRDFYRRLMMFSATSEILHGHYAHIPVSNDKVFAFARWSEEEQLIVVSNFDGDEEQELVIELPSDLVDRLGLESGRRSLDEQLYGEANNAIVVDQGVGKIHARLQPFESHVYRIGGGMFKAPDNAPFMADLPGSGALGKQIYWHDVPSQFVDETRNVVIWLPPGYDENPDRRYKVIYMTDGENLFDPRIASWGVDWGVDEAMMRGVESGDFQPAIVVGAWSTAQRGLEYSPWHRAPDYARFLIQELMPRINAEFRTRTGPEHTFHMGSSMGGLFSYYLVKNHHDVFGACGCVSSHFALNQRMLAGPEGVDPREADLTPYIVRDIENGDTLSGGRFFFDYGTETLDSSYHDDHKPVRAWFRKQGFKEGRDVRFGKYDGADHSERAWRARVGEQLGWLLGE